MNVGYVSSSLPAINLGTQIEAALLSKNMDAMKIAGESLVEMIDQPFAQTPIL